jgi:hypothetical protein
MLAAGSSGTEGRQYLVAGSLNEFVDLLFNWWECWGVDSVWKV